ncbi:hypothetical protein D9M71_609580 [compost metagenome]
MKWCCQVVSTDTPISAIQPCISQRQGWRRTCRANIVQMITSRAICSEGAWLNGLSKPISTSNIQPNSPPSSGRSKVKRSGQSRKQVTLISCAVSSASACRSISWRVRGSRKDSP